MRFGDEAPADEGPGFGRLLDEWGIPPLSVLDTRQGYWQDRRRRWLSLGIRSEAGRDEGAHSRDLMRGEGAARLGTSIFDPVLCEVAYRWWCRPGGTVLDPFAGGSVRGIVAARMGHPYVGIDLSARQLAANREQADEVLEPGDPRPIWIEGDSMDLDVLVPDVRADLVFTCPPYYDLEVYSDDPADLSAKPSYGEFLAAYRAILARAVARLAPGCFAVVVVSEVRGADGAYLGLVPDTIAALASAGAAYWSEGILVNVVGSLPLRVGQCMKAGRKLGRTHQNVIVGRRGTGSTRSWDSTRDAAPEPQLSLPFGAA